MFFLIICISVQNKCPRGRNLVWTGFTSSSLVSLPQRSECEKLFTLGIELHTCTHALWNLCETSNSTELLVLKSMVAAGMIPGTILLILYEYLCSLLCCHLRFIPFAGLDGIIVFPQNEPTTEGKICNISVCECVYWCSKESELSFLTVHAGEWEHSDLSHWLCFWHVVIFALT